MISEATEELIQARWRETIPEQFRADDDKLRTDKNGRGTPTESCRHLSIAIIMPAPPKVLSERFFEYLFNHRHVSASQVNPKYLRYHRVEKREPSPRRRSRKRQQPSLAAVLPLMLPLRLKTHNY